MTPEEHYRAGEAHIDAAESLAESYAQHGNTDNRADFVETKFVHAKERAELHFRAAEVGVQMRERWGHDVAERPLDEQRWPGVHYAPAVARRAERALDAVKAVTGGWARGHYADKLDAFDAVRAIIDGQPDGPGAFDEPGVRYVPADRRADQTVTKINGTLHELDRIISVYAQRTSAEDLAYGRGLANAVQRIHDAMDRGQ